MRRLSPVLGEDRLQIPALLAEWGYPRELVPGELTLSTIYAYGDDVLFWLNSDAAHQPRTAMLHVCVAPESRGRAIDRWALTAVEVLGHLFGLRVLYADPPTEGQRRVMQAFGWVPSETLGGTVLERRLPEIQRGGARLDRVA